MTPEPRNWTASASLNIVTHALLAEYVALPPRGTNPATDETLMIRPAPRPVIARTAACVKPQYGADVELELTLLVGEFGHPEPLVHAEAGVVDERRRRAVVRR